MADNTQGTGNTGMDLAIYLTSIISFAFVEYLVDLDLFLTLIVKLFAAIGALYTALNQGTAYYKRNKKR